MSIIKFLGFLIFLLDKFLAITNKFLFCASVGVAGVQPDRAARAGAAAGADREAHGQGGAVSAGPACPRRPTCRNYLVILFTLLTNLKPIPISLLQSDVE